MRLWPPLGRSLAKKQLTALAGGDLGGAAVAPVDAPALTFSRRSGGALMAAACAEDEDGAEDGEMVVPVVE